MKAKLPILGTAASLLLFSCSAGVCGYADPFVGAAENGHCSPSACYPMGNIQVGPQTGNCSWAYTAGYQYKDSVITGFCQNHLSGTGCHDLGDLLCYPFCGSWDVDTMFGSGFRKEKEKASPGYYEVYLEDAGVHCRMSATPHVSIQRYRFDDPSSAHLMIDFQSCLCSSGHLLLSHLKEAEQNYDDPCSISGYARSAVWVDREYYYEMEFDHPYTAATELPLRDGNLEKAPRTVLDFDLGGGEELTVKISISRNSISAAKDNIASELPGWSLGRTAKAARAEWEKYMGRIRIDGTDEQKRIFYTSMYHMFIQPNNVADAGESPLYSTLSLWDTYRAAHPLYTVIAPELVDDFVCSMLDVADIQGFLPIWSLWGLENYCMIGNHAVPVIVDAYLKGFDGFDAQRAYAAIRKSLTIEGLPKTPWDIYDRYGYFPYDLIRDESVSRTLECCYDDWCAAQMAAALGHSEDAEFFSKRAQYYRNVYDPESGLVRGRATDGSWRTPFLKLSLAHDASVGGDYTEGNAWQYNWHVQHDVAGLIEMNGGPEAFCAKLDTLFTLEDTEGEAGFVADVTGLIGQYAHGNEPSHHVAYLYALAGRPERAQELVREICRTQYRDGVDGLCGNDDCGQMSAWYIFSCLGFYPVNPCGGEFVIGAPQLPKAEIALPGGRKFTVIAKDWSPDHIHVGSVTLNGMPLEESTISYEDIMEGGTLEFLMCV